MTLLSFSFLIMKLISRIAKVQITYLRKIVIFYRNDQLVERRQEEIRNKCLDYWQVPKTYRSYKKEFPTPPSDRCRHFLAQAPYTES